jgi:hypothetical protein
MREKPHIFTTEPLIYRFPTTSNWQHATIVFDSESDDVNILKNVFTDNELGEAQDAENLLVLYNRGILDLEELRKHAIKNSFLKMKLITDEDMELNGLHHDRVTNTYQLRKDKGNVSFTEEPFNSTVKFELIPEGDKPLNIWSRFTSNDDIIKSNSSNGDSFKWNRNNSGGKLSKRYRRQQKKRSE